MPKLRLSLVLAVAASALAGCKSDPLGTNSGDPLTEAEIQTFFFALSDAFSSFSSGPAGVGPAGVGPALATASYNESFNATADCATSGSMSGSVSVHATATDNPVVLNATYRVRVTPNECVVPTETGSITVDGGPYLQMDVDLLLTEATIGFEGAYGGGIAFTSSDGRSGTCRFDVDFSGSASSTSASSSVSGTVCGVSVSATEAFSVD
jgi:hypothetical protein